ncbi:MAG: ATP synthase F1 subunit delta [Bacteroidota bacterium]|nr:ATP synthase F1 subunit delta [Bacteroidota bacterium]
MSEITIARRYAQALNEQAAQAGVLDQVDVDIQLIRDALADSRELRDFFGSPIISREKKAVVVKELFGDRLQQITLTFLSLLVEKRREDVFPAVVTSYRELRDTELGIIAVTVRTAHELSDEDKEALMQAMKSLTGKEVRLETRVDTSILGGVVIRVGDTVYDGSISNQLATLRERLQSGAHA